MLPTGPKRRILITSALPYVNNVPHMGNIIGCVLSADVFARFSRSQGHEVMYVCGTDEHGTTTEAKAIEEGLTPREICDKYYAIHKGVYDWFGISFDVFGRTSAQNHCEITQAIFKDLHANGYILEQEVEQAYDEKVGKFLADRFVEGICPHCSYPRARGDQCEQCGKLLDPLELKDPKSTLSGTVPVRKKSRHLYLDLAKLQPQLEAWFAKRSVEGKWTPNALTTTRAWLEKGLEPRAITRDLSWGVPVPLPGYEGKVFYVWFDAPIGYISMTGQKDGVDWRAWWHDPEVKLYQFMAKDNIPFHTILFPGSLIGTRKQWTLLHHIDATEYLQHEDGKFSKSRGTGLFGDDAMRLGIPADVYRYYLLINRPERSDTLFAWKDLQDKLNAELLGNLGNLVQRTLAFVARYQDGLVRERVLDEASEDFRAWVSQESAQVTQALELCQEKEALRRVMGIATRANQFFQEREPWRTRTDDAEECERTILVLVNVIKDLAIMLGPFLPDTSARIFAQLGTAPLAWRDLGALTLTDQRIAEPTPLFSKIDDKGLDSIRAQLKAKADAKKGGEEAIALAPVQIRAGRIVDVYRHPQAEKLFVEQVDFGGEMRTVVSGLVGKYREEDLRGKVALFVTNLVPVQRRGVESQGMLLTAQGASAQGEEALDVLFVDAPAGTYALGDGSEAKIRYEEFEAHAREVRGGKPVVDGEEVRVGGAEVKAQRVRTGTLT